MIQATAVSTAQTGFIATLKSLLASSRPQPARRAPDEAERARLLAIRRTVANVEEGHATFSDEELVGYVDRMILEPLRDMMRIAATQWADPHLERLAYLLRESDGALASFDEELIDREDFLGGLWGLDELHHALGCLARD